MDHTRSPGRVIRSFPFSDMSRLEIYTLRPSYSGVSSRASDSAYDSAKECGLDRNGVDPMGC